MSKYAPLWEAVSRHKEDSFRMSFAEAESILGFPIDHSLLSFKKELADCGWQLGKISLKGQALSFLRAEN